MSYDKFLHSHQQLNKDNIIEDWNGHLFLPPCKCSEGVCEESGNKSSYDFKKFSDIDISKLVNLCRYIDPHVDDYTKKSIILCEKYSLVSILPMCFSLINKQDKVQFIKSSPEFASKVALLQQDMKVLFPLSGANFIFKNRHTKTSIKLQIMCSYSVCYDNRTKDIRTKGRPRNCRTSKSLDISKKCKFSINIFLDLSTLYWFMKWIGCVSHQHHIPNILAQSFIGQNQLSTSMIEEINKLHQSNVSSSIQQNVLMMNNNVSVPIMTILNNRYSSQRQIESEMTDFEELIDMLKSKSNITYFVMDATSPKTPLLTIKKTRKSQNAIHNNVTLATFDNSTNHEEERHELPHLDSTQQQILKQLFVRNRITNEVKIVLAVGWSRDEDLNNLYKFPEVLKMDCTFKTNREGRPLFSIVGRDSNHKLYTIFRCLLPSEKKAIFHTLLVNVLPKIIGPTICSRIRVCITDGDSQEIKACQAACNLVFKNATHINCYWHLIHNSISRTKVIYNPNLKHILRHWLYFTATKCETEDEMKQSKQLMIVSKIFLFLIIFNKLCTNHLFSVLYQKASE